MARYADYAETEYLPGDVYSAGLDEYRSSYTPQDIQSYLASKKFKFKSEEGEPGTYFERYLNLQANPNSLIDKTIKFPQGFTNFMALSGLGT